MPNTKLTRQKLSNHFQYGRFAYIMIALIAALIGDLAFTMTAYRAPNARRVDIELVSAFANTELAADIAQNALEAGIAYEIARDQAAGIDTAAADYEVPLQEVSFVNLSYDPNADDESAYYGSQKFMVTLAAQEGDIFILSRMLMEQLVSQGVLADLTPYIESGLIDPGDRDLSRVTYPEYHDESEPSTGRECIYALQASTLTGMYEHLQMDPTDMYIIITAYCQNPDTTAVVMQSIIDQLEPEEAAE